MCVNVKSLKDHSISVAYGQDPKKDRLREAEILYIREYTSGNLCENWGHVYRML